MVEGNWACHNFVMRRDDFRHDFPYKLYYGKVGGLGYVVAEDEFEPEPKFINMTTGTPFEGMPEELVQQISDDLHEAASMFRGPFNDEVTENETDNN